jgi:hypothetical protein
MITRWRFCRSEVLCKWQDSDLPADLDQDTRIWKPGGMDVGEWWDWVLS